MRPFLTSGITPAPTFSWLKEIIFKFNFTPFLNFMPFVSRLGLNNWIVSDGYHDIISGAYDLQNTLYHLRESQSREVKGSMGHPKSLKKFLGKTEEKVIFFKGNHIIFFKISSGSFSTRKRHYCRKKNELSERKSPIFRKF